MITDHGMLHNLINLSLRAFTVPESYSHTLLKEIYRAPPCALITLWQKHFSLRELNPRACLTSLYPTRLRASALTENLVQWVGFEPTVRKRADFTDRCPSTRAFTAYFFILDTMNGIELCREFGGTDWTWTNGLMPWPVHMLCRLSYHSIYILLHTYYYVSMFIWRPVRDLNSQPLRLERSTLPIELTSHNY